MARDEEEEGEENHQPELRRSSTSELQSQPQTSSGTTLIPLRPGPDPFLIVCSCFSVVTALSAILCIVVNVLSAIRTFKRIKDGSDVSTFGLIGLWFDFDCDGLKFSMRFFDEFCLLVRCLMGFFDVMLWC